MFAIRAGDSKTTWGFEDGFTGAHGVRARAMAPNSGAVKKGIKSGGVLMTLDTPSWRSPAAAPEGRTLALCPADKYNVRRVTQIRV